MSDFNAWTIRVRHKLNGYLFQGSYHNMTLDEAKAMALGDHPNSEVVWFSVYDNNHIDWPEA